MRRVIHQDIKHNGPLMVLLLLCALTAIGAPPADKSIFDFGNQKKEEPRAALDSGAKRADEAILAGRYDEAVKAATAAELAAKLLGDAVLIKAADEKLANVRLLQAEAAKVAPAIEKLAKSPDDPEANSLVGRFNCFWRGDWAKGLPMLAKGSDAALRALAQEEMAGANDAPMQLTIANAWWDMAAKLEGPPRAFVLDHASDIYTHNLDNLEGPNKTMAKARIAQAPTRLPFPRPAEAAAKPKGGGPVARIEVVADDFVAEIYLNGKPLPGAQRKLQAEIFGAQCETVSIVPKPGDWIVFQVVNNKLRWNGAYYFAAAALTESGDLAFVSQTKSGNWSACDDLKEVARFVAERDYLKDHKPQLVQRPWDRGNQLIAKAAPGWNGEAIWGDPASRSTWIKFVVPEK